MKFFEKIKTKLRIHRGEMVGYEFVPNVNDSLYLVLRFSSDPKNVAIPGRDLSWFVDEIVLWRRKFEKP